MNREALALRVRVRLLRETMQRARLDYLQALLSLRSMQGNAAACDRITRQLKNLLNEQRPRKPRKVPGSAEAGRERGRLLVDVSAALSAPADLQPNPALTQR